MAMYEGLEMMNYEIGKHVVFHDSNQCEVRGIVRGCKIHDDHIELKIELDDTGHVYFASLKRDREWSEVII